MIPSTQPDSLRAYRSGLSSVKLLDRDAERALATRWKTGDAKAGERLIEACLPFVISIALEYRRWGVPLEDIIQQGNIGLLRAAKKFDLGMYDQGETRSVTFDAPGVVRIGCNVHPKMEAFAVVHPNPYVAVSDPKGSYTVAGVPEGTYQMRVWHETFGGEQRLPVTIRDGQVQALDVRLAAPR